MQADEIFLAAVEKNTPGERAAFLDGACQGDVGLRAQVEGLLKSHDAAGSFLNQPLFEPTPTLEAPAPAERPGTVIGPYKLMEQIGEGGMGLVFVGEQQHPVRRKVAVKVIKPGMDTREVIARFEAERQALALMDHPNIARVFDAGATESGRPYFVMELVRGVNITEFCDENRLTPRERLELFVHVCQAVQHAHQKGIIHRDLKATNILVTLHDGTPVVKVIDFGVAKAIGQQLTDKTIYTRFAQMIGTPMYMSPEQAQLSGLDIDTRSDIYALGVLLYELLTGGTPFDKERLRTATYDEIRRIVREEEPPRPSQRISTLLADTLTVVSAQRKTDPKRLSQFCRGDLDWIVMKALEKDRNRRYETANGLELDIQRYLHDEPVLACPPSAWYRFRKFARRNRVALTMTALITAALLMALVILTVSNVWIKMETADKEAALQERDAAQQARTREQDAYAEQLRQGLERLGLANHLLQNGRYHADSLHWAEAEADFTRAAELRPDHSFVWNERAQLHARLGLWDRAATDLAKAFQLHESDYAWHWSRYAQMCLYVGDTNGYGQLRARMVERFGRTIDPNSTTELCRTCSLVPDPTSDPARLVARAERVLADHPESAWYRYLLAIVHYRAGQYGPAVQRARESLAAEPPWHARAINYPILALAHQRLGQADEARQALENAGTAIDQWNQELFEGPVGSLPLSGYWWDWMECQFYYREAKRLIEGSPPQEDPRLRVVRGRAFVALGRLDAAAAEFAKAVALGQDAPQMRVEMLQSRARWYARLGRWKQAAADYTQAAALQPDDLEIGFKQAGALLLAGHRDEYRRLCRRLLERLGQTTDPRTAYLVARMCALAPDAIPNPARAVPLAEQAVAAEPPLAWHLHTLATAHYRAGQFDQALRRLRQSMDDDPAWPGHAVNWLVLAMAHYRLGDREKAQQWLDKAVQWHDKASQEMCRTARTTLPLHDHDWLALQLLRREAETLIKGQKQSGR